MRAPPACLRVSIEYALIKDVNDQPWRADMLAGLLAGRLTHVNLIPLNPTPGSRWTASAAGFHAGVRGPAVARLRDPGHHARYPGSQIDGACGQLAAPSLTSQTRVTPPRGPQTLQISARVP